MASLTGNKIKDTYKSLLKVSDNGELEAASQEITDGAGNSTGVQLNTGGDLTASGTVAFGSLKDSGENITITKFVDEADGIALNDNDTTIPTSAAVKDYVDNNAAVTSVNTQTGAVVLDADDISDALTTNKFTNASDISKLAGIEAGADVTDATNVAAAGAMMSGVAVISDLSNVASTTPTDGQVLTYDTTNGWQPEDAGGAVDSVNGQTGAVSLDTADLTDVDTTAPTDGQVLRYVSASNKYVPTTLSSTAPVDSVNGQTGAVVLDADDISDAATTNKYTTAADISKLAGIEAGAEVNPTASEIKTSYESNANTNAFTDAEKSKLAGIAAGAEVNAVDSVNTQTGAVVLDADDISDATTINKFTTAGDISKLAGIEAGADVTDSANVTTALGSISVTAHSDVTSAGSGSIITSAERTKVGFISVTQAVDLDTMESDISTLNSDKYDKTGGTISGNVTITGDLDVNGTTTTIDTQTLSVKDPLIELANDNTTNSVDTGFYANYSLDAGTTIKYAGLFKDASDSDKFKLFKGLETEPTSTVDTAGTGYAKGDLIVADIDATSGSISGDFAVDTNTLYVDAANNRVGIGTSSPSKILHINGAGDNFPVLIESTDQRAVIELKDSFQNVYLDQNATQFSINIDPANLTTNSQFAVDIDGTERMTIDSSGRVGIGESNPEAELHITDATASCNLRIEASNTSQSGIQFADTDAALVGRINYDHSVNEMSFRVNGGERMTIDSSGNVGIGTSPDTDAELHIYRNGSAARVRVEREFNPKLDLESLNGYAQIGTLNNFPLAFQTNGSERMRIDTSGNVTMTAHRENVSVISTNTSAVVGQTYVLTASLTLTLPASPTAGDKIKVSNMSGTTTPTIARNGNNIAGLAEDLTLDVDNLGIQLVYSGATKGWILL